VDSPFIPRRRRAEISCHGKKWQESSSPEQLNRFCPHIALLLTKLVVGNAQKPLDMEMCVKYAPPDDHNWNVKKFQTSCRGCGEVASRAAARGGQRGARLGTTAELLRSSPGALAEGMHYQCDWTLVRRRTRPIPSFTNPASCDRIIFGVISHLNRSWETKPLTKVQNGHSVSLARRSRMPDKGRRFLAPQISPFQPRKPKRRLHFAIFWLRRD
jgi:hypothetical protein